MTFDINEQRPAVISPNMVWDTNLLTWVRMTQPGAASGPVDQGNPAVNANAWVVKPQASATPAVTSVAGNNVNTTILAANANRLVATVYNDSTAILYLKLGATASATSHTIQLFANAYYEVPTRYVGIIEGIWSAATGSARVTELTV